MDYRIRSGDTLSGIAAKFDVGLAALEAANPQITNPSMIHLNELLNVPASASAHQPAQVPAHVVTYVIQAGDSMSAIATAHNLSLSALEAANPQVASPDSISAGEMLNIPGGAAPMASPDTWRAIHGCRNLRPVQRRWRGKFMGFAGMRHHGRPVR